MSIKPPDDEPVDPGCFPKPEQPGGALDEQRETFAYLKKAMPEHFPCGPDASREGALDEARRDISLAHSEACTCGPGIWPKDRCGEVREIMLSLIAAERADAERAQRERADMFQAAEKEISDAYLRVRALLNAYDTKPGGEDRFEVTEQAIRDLRSALSEAEKRTDTLAEALEDAERVNDDLKVLVGVDATRPYRMAIARWWTTKIDALASDSALVGAYRNAAEKDLRNMITDADIEEARKEGE